MQSKAVALFLSLSVATIVTACGSTASTNSSGEEGGPVSPTVAPSPPDQETVSPQPTASPEQGEEGGSG